MDNASSIKLIKCRGNKHMIKLRLGGRVSSSNNEGMKVSFHFLEKAYHNR